MYLANFISTMVYKIIALLDLEQVAFYTVAFYIGNAIKFPGKSIVAI